MIFFGRFSYIRERQFVSMSINNSSSDMELKELLKILMGKLNNALKEPLGKIIFGFISSIIGGVVAFVLIFHSMNVRLSEVNDKLEKLPTTETVSFIVDEKIKRYRRK